MNYDDWKTTDPRDSEPDYDVREELDDWDRADLDEDELDYYEDRAEERERERNEDRADTLQAIAFWHAVNALAIEYPTFTVSVVPE
jgi:hypothetical protein